MFGLSKTTIPSQPAHQSGYSQQAPYASQSAKFDKKQTSGRFGGADAGASSGAKYHHQQSEPTLSSKQGKMLGAAEDFSSDQFLAGMKGSSGGK